MGLQRHKEAMIKFISKKTTISSILINQPRGD